MTGRDLTGHPEIAQKKTRLKFVQYLGPGTSKRHHVWLECV